MGFGFNRFYLFFFLKKETLSFYLLVEHPNIINKVNNSAGETNYYKDYKYTEDGYGNRTYVEDENGNKQLTYVAVRGPVETKIDYIQKHTISVDNPNLTLNIIMPLNDYTANYFKRYSKFYLRSGADYNDLICWRV